MKSVAIICSKGVGDGLTWMVIAHNLSVNGYKVVAYSDIISEIDSCFPNVKVYPFVKDVSSLNDFDLIVADDHSHVLKQKNLIKNKINYSKRAFF